jgi:formate dehydrogenase maturation protein FdhE
VSDTPARSTRGRAEPREVAELRALKERTPDLGDAVDLHIALIELQRRVQPRIPLPALDITRETIATHQAEGRPLLRFEDIPLDLTDLRLLVRQTADLLHRHGALDARDNAAIQATGRDMKLLTVAADWYRKLSHAASVGAGSGAGQAFEPPGEPTMLDQVLELAMKPFLCRCAEVLQPHAELSLWTREFCPLCGGEPTLAVITPAAERHLICGRCTLQWKFAALTCPYCSNSDRTRITSFATPDGQYRVYACDVCQRYLKAYDARRASRPVMPAVDTIATLPLDAAAIQRGYSS